MRPLPSHKLHKTEKQRSCQKPENSHLTLLTSSSKMFPQNLTQTKKVQGKWWESLKNCTEITFGGVFSMDRTTFLPATHFSKIGKSDVNIQHCSINNSLAFCFGPYFAFFYLVLLCWQSFLPFFTFSVKYFLKYMCS